MTIGELKQKLVDHTISRETEDDEGYIIFMKVGNMLSNISKTFLDIHARNHMMTDKGYDDFVIDQDNLMLILLDSEEFDDNMEIK